MAPPGCLIGFCTTQLPSTAAHYTPLEHQFWSLIGFVRNRGLRGNGAHSPVYPPYHYAMDKGCLPTVARTATNASLLKWEWCVREQAKPDVTGLSKLQLDIAFLLLSPLSTDLKN